MAGTKREREEDALDVGADNIHPSRKRKLEDGEGRQELAKIFNNLRDEIPETRLDATKKLLTTLSIKNEDQAGKMDYATTRLIRGVCSAAKASRQGFSIALIEVLRLGFVSGHLKVTNTVEKIVALTNLESKLSGAERRDYLIGRRSAFQAVLQSGVLSNRQSTEDAKVLFEAIADLAVEKEYLRSECGAMLHAFLIGQEGSQISNDIARTLLESLQGKDLLKTPEGVAVWLTVKKMFPDLKLPKTIWHHGNPLHPQERPVLTKVLLKGAADAENVETNTTFNKKKQAGARQSTPNFAWQVILGYMYEESSAQKFGSFWEDCVGAAMFSKTSSDERKSLGLQIFKQAVASAPVDFLGYVIDRHIVKCIIDQRANKGLLFEATKAPLNQMVTRAKNEPKAAAAMVCKLLAALPANIDKVMRNTLEALIGAADADGVADIVATVLSLLRAPGAQDSDHRRRMLADTLLSIVRSRRSEPSLLLAADSNDGQLSAWLNELLRDLTHLAYTTTLNAVCAPAVSGASRTLFRDRLTSVLGHLADLPLSQAILAPDLVINTMHEAKKELVEEVGSDAAEACKKARKNLKAAAKKAGATEDSAATVSRAFQLLLALGILQVYKQESDAVGVLEDINAVYTSPKDSGDESATMLVELLLSFVSKQSALQRKMAEQVFGAFAPDVNAEALQSMIDILSQKESLAGQQELFKRDDDAEDGAEDSDNEEMVDVEDASDVEIVNGEVVNDNESDEESGSSDDEGDAEADDDEEAIFDKKLADALGDAGMEDSDDDGSDMDDEQMEAVDAQLATVFRERSKSRTSNKKKDKEEARENITQFKNRVLDLLTIYAKSQYANPLALDLVHPLVTLIRESTNPPTHQKAMNVLEQYFDTCKKQKTLPSLESSKAGFKLLSAVHDEMRLGGSKLHAAACSRAAQFLAKILVSMKSENWKKVAEKYVELMAEWRTDPQSKIHGSVFNDWHSWSMQRVDAK